jgi:hypothetical protein
VVLAARHKRFLLRSLVLYVGCASFLVTSDSHADGDASHELPQRKVPPAVMRWGQRATATM